jgi:hypothetical protein
MKKQLIILGILSLSAQISAQNLKELKPKKESSSETVSTMSASAGASQYEMIEVFYNSSTKYNFTECVNDNNFTVKSTMMANGEPDIREKFFADVKRNEEGKIIEFKFSGKGGYKGVFKANEAAYPTYYKSDLGIMVFNGEYAMFVKSYTTSAKMVEEKFQNDCNGTTIWHKDAKVLKSVTSDAFKKMLSDYFNDSDKKVAEVRAQEKEAAEKLEAENRAKYTTKGKDVVSISIKATSQKVKQGSDVFFDIIIKLKDGSELSTDKGAYFDEFDIKVEGLPETYKNQFLMDLKVREGGKIKIPMEVAVSGDQVVVNISSKYHPTLKATHKFVLDYDHPVYMNYDGTSQSTARHMVNAGGLRIEIKLVKHGVTKENILEYKVFSKESGNLLQHFKVLETTAVNASLKGARGWNSDPKYNITARDGGPGGDVKIIVDPNVKSYNLNIVNRGGSGEGLAQSGRDGKVEKVIQKLSW